MGKRVTATAAKNNFGGLLEEVATLGRVDVVRHGRVVAVVLSPRAFGALERGTPAADPRGVWGATHMIPPELARRARRVSKPDELDEDWSPD